MMTRNEKSDITRDGNAHARRYVTAVTEREKKLKFHGNSFSRNIRDILARMSATSRVWRGRGRVGEDFTTRSI